MWWPHRTCVFGTWGKELGTDLFLHVLKFATLYPISQQRLPCNHHIVSVDLAFRVQFNPIQTNPIRSFPSSQNLAMYMGPSPSTSKKDVHNTAIHIECVFASHPHPATAWSCTYKTIRDGCNSTEWNRCFAAHVIRWCKHLWYSLPLPQWHYYLRHWPLWAYDLRSLIQKFKYGNCYRLLPQARLSCACLSQVESHTNWDPQDRKHVFRNEPSCRNLR